MVNEILEKIAVEIELHPKTRLRRVGNRTTDGDRGDAEFYLKGGLFHVNIGVKPFPYETRLFIEGHEEAHAAQFLGNLTKLYEKLNEKGLRFKFLPKEYAKENDSRARQLFDSLYSEDKQQSLRLADKYWGLIEPAKESIADAGGLLALMNASADPRLIERAKTLIHQGVHGFMPSQVLIKFQGRENPISYTFLSRDSKEMGIMDAFALKPGTSLPNGYQIDDLIEGIPASLVVEGVYPVYF